MDAFIDGIGTALLLAAAAGATVWTAGAVYFDLGRSTRWGAAGAVAWAGAVAAALVLWQPLWQPVAAAGGATALVLVWWLGQKPRHDRDWEPAVAVLPRVVRDGDAVTVENLRNFDYPAPGAVTPRYETRTYHLPNLRGLDIVFFHWGSALMCHPVLVFDFGPDGRVCVSAEVRYRKGQTYSVVRSLYRQQELVFVVADERDVILRRTKADPPQPAYLYRLVATPEQARATFLDYAAEVNRLIDRPRWYHGVCANCTTTYYRLPHSRPRWDWRVIANARLAEALYADGRLDTSLPFAELRRAAYLTDVANAAPETGFGDHVRRELEARRGR